MATASIAPPAAAPAPAASTPAAVPSTPVATPAPAPTPAPAASEPQSMEDKLGAAWKTAKDAVPLEESAEPVAEPAAAPVEEPAAAPAEPEAIAEPEEPTAEPAPEVPEFELSLDDGDPASPEALFKELKNDPAAAKFFEDRPELKNKVMAALRRDTENREIRKYVPDVETAKTVTKAASTFQNIDNKFLSVVNEDGTFNPKGATDFLNTWVQEAMFLDDKGQPIIENGQYKLHPALEFTFDHIFNNKLSVLAEKAKASGDERMQAAVDILKGAGSPDPAAAEEVPEHLKTLADSLKAERAALDKTKADDARQRQESAKVAHTQSIDRAESKAANAVKSQLQPRFTASGLTKFESDQALVLIGERVDAELEKDGLYQSLRNSLERQAPSDAREKEMFKLLMTYTNQYIGPITAEVIRQAKGGSLTRQTDKQATVDGQKKASQADPRGTSISAVSPTQKVSNADIEKEYMAAHDGQKPDLEYVLGEVIKRNRARPA